MKIGIMSDNHGVLDPIVRALKIFRKQKVEALVHCGDLGGLETLEIISGKTPCWFVWGNTDYPEQSWQPAVLACNAHWPTQVPVTFESDETIIAVCHGHEALFRQVCSSNSYNYVLHGHSHRPSDRREGKSRIINPGALYRTSSPTVAILDTYFDTLDFCELN